MLAGLAHLQDDHALGSQSTAAAAGRIYSVGEKLVGLIAVRLDHQRVAFRRDIVRGQYQDSAVGSSFLVFPIEQGRRPQCQARQLGIRIPNRYRLLPPGETGSEHRRMIQILGNHQPQIIRGGNDFCFVPARGPEPVQLVKQKGYVIRTACVS